jgi:hypothetical protein
MASKLQAADLARRAGIEVIICHGGHPERLSALLQSQPARGTLLRPLVSGLEARKRFLLGALDAGTLRIDNGAVQALRQGRSLLPVGVRGCEGGFARGDLLRVQAEDGVEIARGRSASYCGAPFGGYRELAWLPSGRCGDSPQRSGRALTVGRAPPLAAHVRFARRSPFLHASCLERADVCASIHP